MVKVCWLSTSLNIAGSRNEHMRTHIAAPKKGINAMDILIFAGVVVFWIILQLWILPSLGVQT